jgi:hypothetical protein
MSLEATIYHHICKLTTLKITTPSSKSLLTTILIAELLLVVPAAALAVPEEPPFPPPLPLPPCPVVVTTFPAAATAVSITAPRLHVNVAPLIGAVKLPGVSLSGAVPLAGSAFGFTHGELFVQPGGVKFSVLVQFDFVEDWSAGGDGGDVD